MRGCLIFAVVLYKISAGFDSTWFVYVNYTVFGFTQVLTGGLLLCFGKLIYKDVALALHDL